MTTISDINIKLINNLNLLREDLSEVTVAAESASLQYEQLTASSSKAKVNQTVNGLSVVGSAGKRISPDGTQKNTAIAIFTDRLGTFGSLTSSTGGALLNKTVTAATAEAASSAFNNTFANTLSREELFASSVKASEALSDVTQLPAGSSSRSLINDAGNLLIEKSNKMRTKIGTISSLLEDITGDPSIEENIETPLALSLGVPSVPITNMNNIPARTFLQTYEEIEAYIRSSQRDITEVVVHATDTSRDMFVDYDVLSAWEVIQRGKSDVGYHLIILRDGSLQVCRSISKMGAHTLRGHNPNSIGIAFVGGKIGNRKSTKVLRSHKSYTMEQFNTFDAFMRAFYTVIPGGQAWGHNNIDPNRRSDPHFNVPLYVQKKFNKFNIQTIEETRLYGSLTIDELIEAQ